MLEEQYMRRAIRLAGLGLGQTNPNPMVGAVIVKNGRVIGEGYHRRRGGPRIIFSYNSSPSLSSIF